MPENKKNAAWGAAFLSENGLLFFCQIVFLGGMIAGIKRIDQLQHFGDEIGIVFADIFFAFL